MGFVARVDVPISARAYRAGAALPALVLGGLPIGLGFATGSGLFVAWGLFFLLECFTDVAILLATRGVPARAGVRSHPTKLGFRVVVDERDVARPGSPRHPADRSPTEGRRVTPAP